MSEVSQQIIQEFKAGKTSSSWLICGPKGIGKKALVNQIAGELLGQNPTYLISGLKWVECGLTEEAKKTFQKAIQSGETIDADLEMDKKSEITMDEMRQGLDFIALKSTLPCKILAISLAEEMNENVQNALLKTLEEPFERTLIILLSENPNKLLPTILSRCKRIVLHTLKESEMKAFIQKNYPTCENISLVIQLSDGMPGMAQLICENKGWELYEKLLSFFCPVENLNVSELTNFLQSKTKEEVKLLCHFVLKFLYNQAQTNHIKQANDFSLLYSGAERQFAKMKNLYLEPSQVLSDLILRIAETLQ